MSSTNDNPIATPDFRSYPMHPGIVEASVKGSCVELRWADGQRGRFHHVWLRDNAADERSVDSHSRERIYDLLDFPLDPRPIEVSVSEQGALDVVWDENGHRSRFHPGWLRRYCYDLGASDNRQVEFDTWDHARSEDLPTYDAGEISDDPGRRLAWLESIQRFGLTLVTDSPADPRAFEAWLQRLLLVRDMNWGKFFDVVYEPEGRYISNKGISIAPHTDGSTREYFPGVQVFHCTENTVEGGESFWVDGYHVAGLLRRKYPQDFHLLSTIPWAMADRNPRSEYFQRKPLIELDAAGNPKNIRDTHWLREPLLTNFDLVEPLYRAYRRYAEMTRDPANRINHRMRAGDVSFIDNRRVLHARGPYLTHTGRRHMQVCYSDHDEIVSAIAVLTRELAMARANGSRRV